MNIREALAAIIQMHADGIVERYAIGGAVGASFYLEPVATLDVDIFVNLQPPAGQLILSLQPILEYLKARGGTMEGEFIVVSGWPIQFLSPGNALVQEALEQSTERDIEGTAARVFSAEHLAAIALQTGRAKDKARLLQFVEAGVLDTPRFQAILTRHGLVDRWRQFEHQFLSDNP